MNRRPEMKPRPNIVGPFDSQRESTCLTCEGVIRVGDKIFWVPKIGVWHEECEKPKNLDAYVKEKESHERLFGKDGF